MEVYISIYIYIILGYDSAELIQNLKVELETGDKNSGINMMEGKVDSMERLGVLEGLRVKEQAISAASEAAELIMRVDDIIRCAPRKRDRQ